MPIPSDDIWVLIAQWLHGTIAPEGLARLEAWKAEDADHARLLGHARRLWEHDMAEVEAFTPDVDAAWSRFQQRLQARIAMEDPQLASKDIQLGSGNTPQQDIQLTQARHPEKDVQKDIQLATSGKDIQLDVQLEAQSEGAAASTTSRQRWLGPAWVRGMAAGVVLALGLGWLWQGLSGTGSAPELAMVTLAAMEEVETHTLPDGSTVTLKPGSTLAYAEGFGQNGREVSLEGEGFFDVRKAEGQRFTVLTPGSRTEVLGTRFNVQAYANTDSVTVQVVEGKVAVSPLAAEQFIYLAPGQQATLAQAGQESPAQKTSLPDANTLAWATKTLRFEDTPLPQVVATLEKHFNTSLTLEQSSGNDPCALTSTFEQAELATVLQVLESAANITVTANAQGYTLQANGCH